MHAIYPLLSGIKGAELGTVELFRRGTASRADWFQDFEGTLQISTGADVSLDSFGGAEVYVNELCDVVVRDTAGVQVRNFVAGDASGAVEYQGQSFTGTDYRSGVQAAGKPTNIQEVLDLWKTQNRAIDWQVQVGSVTRTIASWLGNLAGLFFNVKDPAYGAIGDNVADDTASIQAAFTAASNAGGIVFFPAGTYRVTSALTLGLGASIMGSGAQNTFITIDHASNSLLSVSGGGVLDYQWIDGVALAASQNNTGTLLTIASSARLLVRNCMIGLSTTSQGTRLVSVASNSFVTSVAFNDCVFGPGGSGTTAVSMVDAAMGLALNRCRFIAPATYSPTNGVVYGTFFSLIECVFDNAAATSGTFSCFKGNTTSVAGRIINCDFSAGGGATVTAIELGTYSATAYFIEDNNSFGTSVTAYSYVSAGANAAGVVQLISRERRVRNITSNVTPLALDLDQYGIVLLKRTTNANQTLTTNMAPNGARFSYVIYNNSGGSITTEAMPASVGPFTGGSPTIADGHSWGIAGVAATGLEAGPLFHPLAQPIAV